MRQVVRVRLPLGRHLVSPGDLAEPGGGISTARSQDDVIASRVDVATVAEPVAMTFKIDDAELGRNAVDILGTALAVILEQGATTATLSPEVQKEDAWINNLRVVAEDALTLAAALAVVRRWFVS